MEVPKINWQDRFSHNVMPQYKLELFIGGEVSLNRMQLFREQKVPKTQKGSHYCEPFFAAPMVTTSNQILEKMKELAAFSTNTYNYKKL